MNDRNTDGRNSFADAVNQVRVTRGLSGVVPAAFSPDEERPKRGWYPGKVPFGGDREAERAFLGALRVARRFTDGREFRSLPGEAAARSRACP